MSNGNPEVSLVIVSWNALADLVRCLDSVALSTQRSRIETIVVDNASSEPVAEYVRAHYPDVKLIANPVNRGFSAASNQGFRLARGEFTFFLNPDTVLIEPDAIDRLVEALRSDPATVAVGPRLVFPDGRHQVGDAGMRPSVATALSHSLGLSRWLWRWLPGIYVAGERAHRQTSLDVDWICGAALLVRSAEFDHHHGFSEDLFMYAEDIELGCRLKDGGHRIRYLPGITISHVGGASLRTASSVGAVSTRWIESLGRVYLHLGGRYWRAFKSALGIGFALRGVGCLTAFWVIRDRRLRQRARVFREYLRGTIHLRRPPAMTRGIDHG